jgi:hypothetical protein
MHSLLEDALQATTSITFAGAFEVGFYLVKIRFLELNDFDAVGRAAIGEAQTRT